ncbi:MAG: hypothetical protein Salg2KO_09700 [Salibacteraceae bacterium]
MFDMIKKLQEAQQKMKEIKARLETITVEGKSSDGSVSVKANGNRKILGMNISEDASIRPVTEMKDQILEAVSAAVEAADQVNESEMKAAASGMMPGMGGLFSKS